MYFQNSPLSRAMKFFKLTMFKQLDFFLYALMCSLVLAGGFYLGFGTWDSRLTFLIYCYLLIAMQ